MQRRNITPRVAVAILNYNGLRWLQECLPSVMRSSYKELDVYVIDNGSSDGSVRYVESEYPAVKLITFKYNLGFAKAYNEAIRIIQADYVVLLNNDVRVLNDNWLDLLVKDAESDNSVAAVGCKLVSMQNHEILDSVGGMGIKYWRGFVDIGKNEPDTGQYDKPPVNPFSLCGAAMLVRRASFEQINGFDEKFHSYLEDVDLCWRWRLVNYRLIYEPSARVAHFFSGTAKAKNVTPWTFYLSNRNLLRAIIKNCGYSLNWALRTYLLFATLLTLGFFIGEPTKARAMAQALGWNLLNLKNTYAHRLLIQSTRQASENEIIRKMYPNLPRFQPKEHGDVRRILNIIFDHEKNVDRQ